MEERDNNKITYKQQLYVVYMSSNNAGHRTTDTTILTHRVSVPNARCVGHGMWNEVLFKCPCIQVTPGPPGENYDVITAMCLAF